MSTADQLLAVARGELGRREDPAGSNRQPYAAEAGHANGQPWCATFVVACFRRAGIRLPSESAYTPTMANGFRAAGRWTTTPQAGDVVFFQWPSMGRIAHVGIVETVHADGSITTIEGNTDAAGGRTGGCVMRQTRKANIVGYGLPAYATAPQPCPGVTRPGDGMPPKAPSAVTRAFQELLIAGAFLPDVPGSRDGRHGKNTSAAIIAVEKAHGLRVDAGIGGKDVWAVLTGAR